MVIGKNCPIKYSQKTKTFKFWFSWIIKGFSSRKFRDAFRTIIILLPHVNNHSRLIEQQNHLKSKIPFVSARLGFYKTSKNKAQLQINGLTTNGTANGKKVHPNFAITLKTSEIINLE